MTEFILFLSKLLPLFLYPLGLTTVFLMIAIIHFWKHPRRASVALAFALGLLLLSSNVGVAQTLTYSLERQYPVLIHPPKAKAIIVLGGSTFAPNPPRLWPEVNDGGDRVLYGAKLYREGKAPQVLLSGGRIAWQGGGQAEAIDMRTLMETMGVPRDAVILEPQSLNTFENARNTKAVLTIQNIDGPLLLVTSAFHMPRSMAIFRKQGLDVIAAPTDFWVETDRGPTEFKEAVLTLFPDAEALEQTTKIMKEYMGFFIYKLRGWL